MTHIGSMDTEQGKFLQFLVYLFFKYRKFDQAYVVAQFLSKEYKEDLSVNLLLAAAAYYRGQPYLALPILEKLKKQVSLSPLDEVYFLLKSKVLWALGEERKSCDEFHRFLVSKGSSVQIARLAKH